MDQNLKLLFSYLGLGVAFIVLAIALKSVNNLNTENSNSNSVIETTNSTMQSNVIVSDAGNYILTSYSGNNEKFGDGDTWEVSNVTSDENVLFVFVDKASITSPLYPETQKNSSYEVKELSSVPLTTYREGTTVGLFASNGIYSTPEVSEIWVTNPEEETSVLIWKK